MVNYNQSYKKAKCILNIINKSLQIITLTLSLKHHFNLQTNKK